MTMQPTDVAVVVGNPKVGSRTLHAATRVAEELTGTRPSVVIDVAALGERVLGWGEPTVAEAIQNVASSTLVVFATPTYKASYTGLLKLFLDQIPAGGLSGVTAVPLMLGAGPGHALAPELLLKPVLVELGALCPTQGGFMVDSDFDIPGEPAPWLKDARARLRLAGLGVPAD